MASNSSSLDFVRNKGEIESYDSIDGNFTTLEVKLQNLPAQTITVAKYRKNSKEEKDALITIKKTIREKDENGNEKERTVEVARFYNVKNEGDQIFMDILDPTLKKIYTDTISQKEKDAFPDRDFSSAIAISGLEIDKKMDIRVKGLGKDMGVLFSAFGFQLRKTAENEENINKVFKNEDSPFNVEISESFIDKAITNELEEKKSGCLLSESMSITSPEMQALLRASLINDAIGYDSKKRFANGRIELEQITFNDGEKRRPLSFMKIDGKPYVYASLVSRDPLAVKSRKTELTGKFYELTNFSDDKLFGNNIRLELFDKNLSTLDGAYSHTRTLKIPILNEDGESEELLDYLNKIAKDRKFDKGKIQATPNATLSNENYGEAERTYGEAKIYDSTGFVRNEKVEGAFENSNSAEFVAQMAGDNENQNENTQENVVAENADAENSEAESGGDAEIASVAEPPTEEARQVEGENEAQGAENDRQGAVADAASQAPSAPPAPPATGNNEEQKEEKKEDKGKTSNSILDQPFLEDKEAPEFNPDESNKLAAKLGLTFSGIGMLLVALSCFLGPLVGFIGSTVFFGLAAVSFVKPWEAKSAKSNAIAKANLALAKAKQKEIERMRKAELEGQKNAKKAEKNAKEEAEIKVMKDKNSKYVTKLGEENAFLQQQKQELALYKQALLEQNELLIKKKMIDGYEINEKGEIQFPENCPLTDEEKAELQQTLDTANQQMKEDEKNYLTPDRVVIHRQNYTKTVEALNDVNNQLSNAQERKDELLEEQKNLTEEIEKLTNENNNVKEYVANDEKIKNSKNALAMTSILKGMAEDNSERATRDIEIENTKKEIAGLEAKQEELKKSDKVTEYLERVDKLDGNLKERQKIEDLQAKQKELKSTLAYQRTIVENDILNEAESRLITHSQEKNLKVIKNNNKQIKAIDHQIELIDKQTSKNEKLAKIIEQNKTKEHLDDVANMVLSSDSLTERIMKSNVRLKNAQEIAENYSKNVLKERNKARYFTDGIMKNIREIEESDMTPDEKQAELNKELNKVDILTRSSFAENKQGWQNFGERIKANQKENENRGKRAEIPRNKTLNEGEMAKKL